MGLISISIGITIFGIIILAIGNIAWHKKWFFWLCNDTEPEWAVRIFTWIAGIVAVCCIIIALCVPISTEKQLASYEAMKITIEDARKQNGLNAIERAEIIITIATDFNYEIMKHRRLIDNEWVGMFYRKEIVDLPLILWNNTEVKP